MDTHYFGSTGEAYDASQCRDEIKDGDLLVVLNEGVIGFLVQAWPVSITKGVGHFHTFSYVDNSEEHYQESIERALNLIKFYGLEVDNLAPRS